jgi:hypothetical protein
LSFLGKAALPPLQTDYSSPAGTNCNAIVAYTPIAYRSFLLCRLQLVCENFVSQQSSRLKMQEKNAKMQFAESEKCGAYVLRLSGKHLVLH